MTKHDPALALEPGLPAAESLLGAFNDLRDELMSTLVFMLGNPEDAHDAAQETFIKCWNARGQLDQIHNLRAWIFRVSFNTAKDLRKSAWRRRSRPLSAEQYTLAAADAPPAEALERREALARVREEVRRLRPEEQEVFLLRQNGALTYDQIAELRDCPVGTVKTQMRSALEKLRKVLQ